MSDFLGNLAARSLGRLETLTPRLPARFEPAVPAAPLEGLEAEREVVASVPSELPRAVVSVAPGLEPAPPPPPAIASRELAEEPTLRRQRRSAPPPERVTPAVPEPSADLANRLAPPRRPSPELPRAENHPAENPAENRLAPPPAPPPPPPELTEEPTSRRRRRRSAPPLERIAPAGPEPAAAANLANRLAPHPPFAPPPPDRVERREPDERLEHPPAIVRLEPKVTLAPSVSVAAPRRSVAREAQPSTTPQPTIQVTIGRLEVRATPAPAASAAPARKGTAPPIMTLEEYLNRRSRGGGR